MLVLTHKQPISNYDQNYINKTGEQTVSDVLQNLPAAVGNFLPAVIRAPNGTITEVIESYENLGNTRNKGIEFGVNYVSKEYDWGKVDFEFSASYLYNTKQQTPFWGSA